MNETAEKEGKKLMCEVSYKWKIFFFSGQVGSIAVGNLYC